MSKLKYTVKAYETWVANNPKTVCDVETTVKWVSFFIAGRTSNSSIMTELTYSLSKLLVLYNDHIITKDKKAKGETVAGEVEEVSGGSCYRLKVMLTTLEYCEVFIEIFAKKVLGKRGRWLFITSLQVLKAAGRFFILKHSVDQIIVSPALPALNRKSLKRIKEKNKLRDSCLNTENNRFSLEQNFTFKLKRTGRIVRKIEGAPPLQCRSFKFNERITSVQKSQLPEVFLRAEYLYVAKPLIHLASMGVFGEKSWKQYIIPLAFDFASINMYRKNHHLMSKQQQLILSHRCVNLLLYLMRSPFYENFTKSRLERFLEFVITHNIPFLKVVARPLRDYVPYWQSTYFYMWST